MFGQVFRNGNIFRHCSSVNLTFIIWLDYSIKLKCQQNLRMSELSNSRFSHSINPDRGLLHFLTFFIFLALLKTKRFLLSTFLTIFYAFVFVYGISAGYYARRLGGEEFSPKVYFFDSVYRGADIFEYVAALFISILLFWQISILLRMLIKTLQKERALP